ncbi:MAG: hypothetical protein GY754_22310 [bacterium]|nr:hypothetical protein [bacterium]
MKIKPKHTYNLLIVISIQLLILLSPLVNLSCMAKRSREEIKNTAQRTADQIAFCNSRYIWDLDMRSLKESSEIFFRDPSIALIKITDTTNTVLLELKRDIPGKKVITLKRDIVHSEKKIAALELKYIVSK